MDLAPALKTPTELEIENQRLLRARAITGKAKKTPLESLLTTDHIVWLAQYCSSKWNALYGANSNWRNKLEKCQQQAEDCFEWRRSQGNRNVGRKSIFEKQNDSLNLIGAFAEFFTAQAENDLFGSSPWYAAKPVGKNDKKLADQLTAHSQWKIGKSNLGQVYPETIGIVANLGTCFTKQAWKTEMDSYTCIKSVLCDKATKQPILTSNKDYIFSTDKIIDEDEQAAALAAEQGVEMPAPATPGRRYPEKDPKLSLDGEYDYLDLREDKTNITYKGVRGYNLDFRDVAFDPMAPSLELQHTDFFHKFKKPLFDVARDYDLDPLARYRLYGAFGADKGDVAASTAAAWREEQEADMVNTEHPKSKGLENVNVTLVEGYIRVDPTGQGKATCNAYVVFCPQIDMVLKCDYLANVTPKGRLPITAHTINRIPGRIVGRGFFEKFDGVQTFCDDLFNRINYHDRKSSEPITGRDKSKLLQEDQEPDEKALDDDVNLKPDAKMADYLQFAQLPDQNERTVQMLQMMIQMIQLRTGITAAQQGELAGLPENNTATGIRQLMSRAAVLLKSPIQKLKISFGQDIQYVVTLIYANHDAEETFLFGEGENQELVAITPEMVANMDMDIELTMVQSQNQSKLENSDSAIGFLERYIALPEQEKGPARGLFLQALRALEFSDADTIIRMPVMTLEAAIATLPKEMQQEATLILEAGLQVVQGAATTKPSQQKTAGATTAEPPAAAAA